MMTQTQAQATLPFSFFEIQASMTAPYLRFFKNKKIDKKEGNGVFLLLEGGEWGNWERKCISGLFLPSLPFLLPALPYLGTYTYLRMHDYMIARE